MMFEVKRKTIWDKHLLCSTCLYSHANALGEAQFKKNYACLSQHIRFYYEAPSLQRFNGLKASIISFYYWQFLFSGFNFTEEPPRLVSDVMRKCKWNDEICELLMFTICCWMSMPVENEDASIINRNFTTFTALGEKAFNNFWKG